MVKSSYFQLVFALLFLGFSSSVGQTLNRNEMEEQAYIFYNAGDYANAYTAFDKLNAMYPKEYDYKLRLGLCCLSYPDKNARAIEIFSDIRNERKDPTSDYYLGKAYQVNYKFDDALAILEPLVTALSESKKEEDKAIVTDATLGILNCKNGKYLVQNKIIADISNIGAPINTSELEAAPAITADESMMIFTYSGTKSVGGKVNESLKPDPNGKYGLDVYKSMRNADGSWGAPEPITSINTPANDAAIALSPGGNRLYVFYSDSKNSGDIYVSKLENNEFSKPEPLNANINTPEYWEGSCSESADRKYLYFASERPGGLGGRDLWVSEKIDGDWGPAVNLGPKINTPYDDDAPFIHPDGITMFFSSKGHQSIGGYDIMFAIKDENGWTEPKSMGIPLNTTGDDSFYVLNSKGDRGYFSSYRSNSGGKGEKDIYSVTPGILGEKPVVAVVKGTVYGNDKPLGAKMEILKGTSENLGPYSSDMMTGKYLNAFSPGSVYEIRVSAEGFNTVTEKVDLTALTAYMEKTIDFRLVSADIASANKAPETATTTSGTSAKTTESATTTTDPVKKGEPVAVTEPVKKDEPVAATEPVKKDEPVAVTGSVKEKKTKEPKQPKQPKEEKTKDESVSDNSDCSEIMPDFGPVKSKSLNDPSWYGQLLSIAGNYCSKGTVFKVQIGAYRLPDNFKYNNLKGLGKVESESYPDGITRFTQKEFTTLNAAEKHRQKVIGKGQTDAWIVVFKDGKRYTLEDFIMVDFMGKTIN